MNPQDVGGIMTLADVYCRFNRARGMEASHSTLTGDKNIMMCAFYLQLVSPDDVVSACKLFESLGIPLRLRVFQSGVLVVQSLSHSEEAIIEDTVKQVCVCSVSFE